VGSAVSLVTPLSRPYVLDRLVPQPARAIDGNPATPVTRAS
jgi:iron complex transport system substrate-binding protein